MFRLLVQVQLESILKFLFWCVTIALEAPLVAPIFENFVLHFYTVLTARIAEHLQGRSA